MSKLKITENLFLEKQELNRLIYFLQDEGAEKYDKLLINSYGIIPESNSDMGFGFNVTTSATADSIDVAPGIAIDNDLNHITGSGETTVLPQSPSDYYFIKIKYGVKNTEKGTVGVDANGNMVGTGTEFTKVLRGQPNFPTKIRIWDGTAWTTSFEVLQIVDDLNVILQGDFTGATYSAKKYGVVGSFSPDFTPNEDQSLIYEYDSVTYSAETSAVSDPPPALDTNKEFYIAICQNIGGAVSVIDIRDKYKFSLNPMFADGDYHKLDRINIFNKASQSLQKVTPITVNLSGTGILQLGDNAVEPFMKVDFSAWPSDVLMDGLEMSSTKQYEIGTSLWLERVDEAITVRLQKPITLPSSVKQGFIDYSAVMKDNGGLGDQITDRRWLKGEMINLYCLSKQLDGTVWRSQWAVLSNLGGDTLVVRETQDNIHYNSVFVNGVDGITDTASADANGARAGSVFIS